MTNIIKPYETVSDYVTGRPVPLVGAEENRQLLEKFLVEEKGYSRGDIAIDVPLVFEVAGEMYRSTVDLVVSAAGRPLMAVKCAAGSLGSREREAVAAARLAGQTPLPLAMVSDGRTAVVLDAVSGRPIGESLNDVYSREALEAAFTAYDPEPLSAAKLEKERLVFRTYDSMNVNAARHLK